MRSLKEIIYALSLMSSFNTLRIPFRRVVEYTECIIYFAGLSIR